MPPCAAVNKSRTIWFCKAVSPMCCISSSNRVKASVQFNRSVVFDSLPPHGLQHNRLPCPSPVHPTPGVSPNLCPSSRWYHPTISSSVVLFSSCLQSFLASGSFPMSQFFTSGGQSIGVSASGISHSNEHSGLISFRIDWFELLAVQRTLKSLLQHHRSKHIFLHTQFSLYSKSHIYTWLEKTRLAIWTIVSKAMSLFLNVLSRLAIAFLPRSKRLLISRLQTPSTVILEPKI